ncbi:testis-expressed protein 22 isoform X2 [Mustela erminea]|uniref:testis-expressed protein 22 isoform X2 n=1 Tax=Mustela erminea TaxID=36723 RepID=UPI0013868E79|nr:testis-expressed protein 22 isoform X2 [Mustela erminea]
MERREPRSHGPAGKAPRRASPVRSPSRAWGRPSAPSGGPQVRTQDWVCEPPESRPASRRWSVSIHERRQLATQDGGEEPGTGAMPSRGPSTDWLELGVLRPIPQNMGLPPPTRTVGPNREQHLRGAPGTEEGPPAAERGQQDEWSQSQASSSWRGRLLGHPHLRPSFVFIF